MHSMPFPQLPLDEPDFFAPLRFSAHGGLPQQGLSMGLGAAHRCLADLQLGPFERPYGEGCVSNSSTLDGADPESAVFEGPSNMLLVQRQSNGGGRRGGPPALPPPPSHLFHQAASARSLTGAALPSSPFEPAAAFPQRPHCAASSGNSGGSRCLQQLPSAPSSADVTMLPSHRAPPSPFGPPLPLQLPFSAAALGAPSSGGLLPGSSGGRRPRANEWVSSGGQGADEPAAGWGEPGRFGAAALAGAADQGDAHAGFVADASSHQQQLVPYGASSALPASSFTPLGAESFLGDFTARQSHRAFGEDHVGAGGAGVGSVRQQAIFGECSNRPGSLQRGLLVQQRAEVPGGGGFAEQQVLMLQQHQQRQQQHGRPGNGSSNSSNSTAFARCTTASVAANSSRSNGGGSSTNSSTATCSTTTTFTTTTTSSSSSSAGERRTLGRATHRLGGSSATLDDPFGWSQAAASGGSGGIGGVCNTSMDLGRLAATTRPHNFSNSSPFGVFDSAPSHRSNGGGAAAAAGAWAPTPMPPPMPMPTMSTGGAGAGGSTRPLLQEARDAATTATSCPLPCLPPGLLLPGVISAALDGPQPGTAQPAAATARPTIDWESLPAATAAADDAGPCSGASVKSCGSTVVGGDAAAMLAAGKHSPAVDPSRSLLRRTVTPPALLPTLQLPATPPQAADCLGHRLGHRRQ
ncbi:hypothetical protein HXX76_008349 [Chlamydomonas incerta]|uniref:Uncharacterized protein n=1 Tax=Chlamydomonas incerta TaxID=51695 RepID=A0A835STX5_CHLIN|nr:hypothetical protein HXX76_008349 [Chlamydomonas incerta]|eukprot:KAG2433282.1 hypothetical protein HXX76_008349 [Chlamydomonas incerta]